MFNKGCQSSLVFNAQWYSATVTYRNVKLKEERYLHLKNHTDQKNGSCKWDALKYIYKYIKFMFTQSKAFSFFCNLRKKLNI